MGLFRKLHMCSLRELLEMCSSLESMVQTNYDSELGSHSISNTQPDFFPGPGIRSWIRTTNIQSCSVAPDLLVLRNQPTCSLQKRCLIPALQQDSRCKAGTSAKSLQSCLTLCNPMDCSPPGSSVHGTLQARILLWAAISFSRGSSWLRNSTQVSFIAGRFFNIWATRDALDARLGTRKFVFPTFPEFQIKSMA